MLCCTVGDLDNRPMEFGWHVGQQPQWLQDDVWSHRIRSFPVEIQADGDELDEIYHQFPNIPQANLSRVVIWTGDFARFIALNLQASYSHKGG
jgi:hypothetical protein